MVQGRGGRHGPGVVPLPGRSTFYKLIDVLAAGRHTFGSAVTRRQTANRPHGHVHPDARRPPGEQVQIDSTPIDVLVLLENGVPVRADLTIAVDVATRTICAAVLRPVGTKAVDAALLLARMLVPEPMRPGWSAALRMSASRLPHGRLLDIDTRMELAAARPVIVPDTIVIDGGKVFVSDTFTRACERLGVSIQRASPRTPTDKAIVEATFGSINTLFCQHVAAYTGSNTTLRGTDAKPGAWTLPELQDLLDEWLLAGWQSRPHDGLRDPLLPRRALSPNEMYAAMVAAAGYLPLTLSGEDYLELLPVAVAPDQRLRHPHRLPHLERLPDRGPIRSGRTGATHPESPAGRDSGRCTTTRMTPPRCSCAPPDGWVSVPWTHCRWRPAPFAEFTWRHARSLAAEQRPTTTPTRPRSPGCSTTCSPAPRPARSTSSQRPRSPPAPRSPRPLTGHRSRDDATSRRIGKARRWRRGRPAGDE